MKRPLRSLTVFCAVFFGIILFCVILGGYTDLLRAQNRIGENKELVITQCQKRMDLLPGLITIAGKLQSSQGNSINNSDQVAQLKETTTNATAILSRVNSATAPLKKETVEAFEQSQVRLGQQIAIVITALKDIDATNTDVLGLEKDFQQLGISVWVTSNRYNKEAKYFNDRKNMFPGFLSAKIFGLDKTRFFEITASLFKPETLGADEGAS